MLAGVGVGAVLLAAIAWAMLRYSRKLPIAEFFRYSSILMAVLAVVLAGKGVSAIQEAGLVGITPVHGVPRIDLVGLQPSVQVIAAQLAALIALLVGFRLTRPKPTSRAIRAASWAAIACTLGCTPTRSILGTPWTGVMPTSPASWIALTPFPASTTASTAIRMEL